MKAQLSLELLLYLALAGLSFAFAMGVVSRGYAKLGNSVSYFELSQFADTINTALMGSGSFVETVYLPVGLCGSTAYGNELSTRYGPLYFTYEVNSSLRAFCPDGTYAPLGVSVKDGAIRFDRG